MKITPAPSLWAIRRFTVTLEGQEPVSSDTSKLQEVGIVISLGISGNPVEFTGSNTLVGVLG